MCRELRGIFTFYLKQVSCHRKDLDFPWKITKIEQMKSIKKEVDRTYTGRIKTHPKRTKRMNYIRRGQALIYEPELATVLRILVDFIWQQARKTFFSKVLVFQNANMSIFFLGNLKNTRSLKIYCTCAQGNLTNG